MSRSKAMLTSRKPFVGMPATYELDGHRQWCRMKDVCVVARRFASIHRVDFKITPEELICRFAALIRPNKPLVFAVDSKDPNHALRPVCPKKIFRYSKTGKGFWGTEVPMREQGGSWDSTFKLDIDTPYPKTLFVTAEWASDVFDAIRRGAGSAVDYQGRLFGVHPQSDVYGSLITLKQYCQNHPYST